MGQTQNSQGVMELKGRKMINVTSAAYGDGSFCEQEQSFIKCLSFQEKNDARENLHNVQIAKRTIHKNLVKVLNIEEAEEKAFCSHIFKVFYELEYFETDLGSEVRKRYHDQREFNEIEISTLISDLLNVLAFLENAGISHQSLSPNTILFNKQLEVKLVHPVLSRIQSNFSHALNSNGEKSIYLCPILQKAALEMNYSPLYNSFRSDKFILGIILLEIFENEYPTIFDANADFLEKKVMNRLETIAEFFPTLSKILANLLTLDEESRGSFADSIYFLQNGEFQEKSEKLTSISLRKNKMEVKVPVSNSKKELIIKSENESESQPVKSTLKPMNIHESNVLSQTRVERPKSSKRNQISKINEEEVEHSDFQNKFKPKTNYSSFLDNFEVNHQSRFIEPSSNIEKYLSFNQNVKKDLSKEAFGKGNSQQRNLSPFSEKQTDFREEDEIKKKEAEFQMPLKTGLKQTLVEENSIASGYLNNENRQVRNFKIEDSQFTSKLDRFVGAAAQPLVDRSNREVDNTSKYDLQTILAEERLKREQKSKPTPSSSYDLKENKEVYADGSVYTGSFLNGLRDGRGTLLYPDGSKYEGAWKEGQMHGTGSLFYASGKLAYTGQWANDKFHGKGAVYNDVGETFYEPINFRDFEIYDDMWVKYDGELRQDNKEGYGIWEFANGEIFKGDFKNDMVDGKGEFRTIDGRVIKGFWEKNEIKSIVNT